MTVPAQTASQVSTANGVTTVFPYNFRILDQDDLLVQVDGVTMTVGADYTVSGVGVAGGGNVTFAVAPADQATVLRKRNMAYRREEDYQSGGDLISTEVNRDYDAAVMMIQQLDEAIARSLRVRAEYVGLVNTEIPPPEEGSLLGWQANAVVNLGSTFGPADLTLRSDVASSASGKGAELVAFPDTLAPAYLKTVSDIINGGPVGLLRFIDRTKHAAILAGTSTDDVQADLQTAVNSGARRLVAARGKYVVDGTVTIDGAHPVCIEGEQAGTAGTRFHAVSNATMFHFTGQGTLRDIGLIGTNNALHTLQTGVLIDNTNGVDLFGVVASDLYDTIHIREESFYCRFDKLRLFNAVNRHIRGSGSNAAGYAFDLTNSVVTASAGTTTYYFENAGSITFNNVITSPATVSERCLHIISNAVNSGIHQFSNTVFEGSQKEACRIEGTALAPIKFVHFSNCYFNQSGPTQDAITLLNTRDVSLSNCFISGTNAGVTIAGETRDLKLADCEFQINGSVPVIRTLAGGKVNGLHITNPTYAGGQRLVDLTATAAGDLNNINIVGGDWGMNGTPLNLPAGCGGKITATKAGNTQTKAGGVTSFNGGVSLFQIPHGLLDRPTKISVLPASPDAGNAEIREVTVSGLSTIDVQCKGGAAAGVGNVSWRWYAEC